MIAISSSFKQALLAVEVQGRQEFMTLDANCKHSENIMYNIDKMLDNIGCGVADNDSFSVVVGPGSFTGIRIGIALIKGLACANGGKVIPLTTFDLIAYSYVKNFKPKGDFYCVIDALSGLVYIEKHDRKGGKVGQAEVISREELASLEGIKVGLSEENVADERVSPSPQELLELAKMFEGNSAVTEKDLVPLYLRKSQAEVSLEKRRADNKSE